MSKQGQDLSKEEFTIDSSSQESKIIIPKEEPNIEYSESEFPVKGEQVDIGIFEETIFLPSHILSLPDSLPTSIEVKNEPFEIISDNTPFVSSLRGTKKETPDTGDFIEK